MYYEHKESLWLFWSVNIVMGEQGQPTGLEWQVWGKYRIKWPNIGFICLNGTTSVYYIGQWIIGCQIVVWCTTSGQAWMPMKYTPKCSTINSTILYYYGTTYFNRPLHHHTSAILLYLSQEATCPIRTHFLCKQGCMRISSQGGQNQGTLDFYK